MKFRRILCPIDFSETSPVGLAPATSIATQYGSELVLLHVLNFPFAQIEALPPGFDVEAYYESMSDEAIQQMQALIDVDAAEFMHVTTQVERGVPLPNTGTLRSGASATSGRAAGLPAARRTSYPPRSCPP